MKQWFKSWKAVMLLLVFMLAFLLLNDRLVWKWMYPIQYTEEIQISSQNYQLNPYLILAIIRVESNFDHSRVSKVGAVGLMQVMPGTADWIVEQAGYSATALDALERPDVNIEIGSWYIQSLSRQFKGNWIAVLAAYNAGPGNVRKWMHDGWNPSPATIDQIPFGETRHYVQRVLYFQTKYEWIYERIFDKK